MSSQRTVIHTHIEKTAGTSLLKFFEQTVGEKRIAFYDPTTDSIIRVSDLILSPSNDVIDRLQLKSYAFWPLLKKFYFNARSNKRHLQKVPQDIAVIHGHFVANRFDKMVPQAIRTVVIRDPMARMKSHFDHWKRAKGRNQWRVMIPYDSEITFETFAMLPAMQNYQSQALAKKELKAFDLVGITERLDTFTQALHDLLVEQGHTRDASALKKVKHLNIHQKNHQTKKSGFESAFRKFHKEDYALYKEAMRLAK